jgi:hypothetical protein
MVEQTLNVNFTSQGLIVVSSQNNSKIYSFGNDTLNLLHELSKFLFCKVRRRDNYQDRLI